MRKITLLLKCGLLLSLIYSCQSPEVVTGSSEFSLPDSLSVWSIHTPAPHAEEKEETVTGIEAGIGHSWMESMKMRRLDTRYTLNENLLDSIRKASSKQ
jgi:hypothetical protein